VIRFVLHAANAVLIIAMIGCLAGALAGLIVLFPFVAGAWGLNLMTLLAYEQNWAAAAEASSTRPSPRHPGGNP
jgi:hypothetical protein